MDLTITPNTNCTAFNIQELTWDQVRQEVKKCNRELFQAIDALDPGKRHTFIKARYPYGAIIVDDSVFHLPHKSGTSIPITSPNIDERLKKKFLYSPIPLALPLNKASEVFVKAGERIIPLKFLSPGKLFGLFEVTSMLSGLQTAPIWCVSSGARTIFMLPKIADKIGYQRLKKELNVPISPPRSLSDHWEIFTHISNHPTYINNWHNDVLFFTDSWFEKLYDDPKWACFYNYLFRESTIQKHFTRDDTAFDLTWQCFAYAIGSRNLRPRPYLLDTVKHLVAIAVGVLPGFQPADSNEQVAPTRLLQDIYTQLYGLKNYLPTIMHPHNLMHGQELRPLYYSLAFPSLPEGSPPHKQNLDIIADMRDIKLLFDTLYNTAKNGRVTLPKTYDLVEKVKYEFFHSEVDIYNEVKPARDLPLEDTTLINDKKIFTDREFCATAPFLSGCIRTTLLHSNTHAQ